MEITYSNGQKPTNNCNHNGKHSHAEKNVSDFVINKEWQITKKIGAGSFGEIFSCTNIKSNFEAAVKLEIAKSKSPGQLSLEHKILKLLAGGEGIAHYYWYGRDGVNNIFTCLVMERLGPSLEDLALYCSSKFSVKTVLMLADQMLKRIEYLHQNFLIHRDIKPDNFLMGSGKRFNIVYVIDFGLSKYYMDPKTKQHIPYREFRNLTGTARYCSINAHEGYEQSRRDDLEALGYVFVYFLKGHLPWQGLQADSKREKFRMIHSTKLNVAVTDLCSGLPECFQRYIQSCRKLKFTEDPDYDELRKLFATQMLNAGYKYDSAFDWVASGTKHSSKNFTKK